MTFLLDYDKIHSKQKCSAIDIVESLSKNMWLFSSESIRQACHVGSGFDEVI